MTSARALLNKCLSDAAKASDAFAPVYSTTTRCRRTKVMRYVVVGAGVGTGIGFAVGGDVGMRVGTGLGISVGASVGSRVGSGTGAFVVGCGVGAPPKYTTSVIVPVQNPRPPEPV